jgi:AcrR family transcriptional regulator
MGDLEDTRQRLLEAAGPIFAEKGFVAASVGEITERAGANRAAVNYHFRNKEQLYVEAVRHAYEACAARAPLPDWPALTPAEGKLRDLIRTLLTRILAPDVPAWQGQLIMREVAQPTAGACAEFVRDFVRPLFNVLTGILRELTPADLPARTLHMLSTSIAGQCLHYHHARNVLPLLVGAQEYAGYDLETITEHVWRFSLAALRGLYPGGEGGRP